MRPLLLSLASVALILGAVWAQNSDEGGNTPQLPVGQSFKQFEWPIYQDGKLKATLSADTATGITLNRAETSNLMIKTYEDGKTSTTITSPKADLYVAEQKMRTKNTVMIVRDDMDASSQSCDFDLKSKKYVLRTNVKVVLKHFDVSLNPVKSAPASTNAAPAAPHPARSNESLLDSPGSYSNTNSAPIAPPSPDAK